MSQKNIAVVGAGIVGVTTAYELAAQGHQVTVFERNGSAAEGASFANAGVLSAGYVAPWAAPGMPRKVLRYLFQSDAPARLRLPLGWSEMKWLRQWLSACKPEVFTANRASLFNLASLSIERLQDLIKAHHFELDQSSGYMVLLRSEQDRANIEANVNFLKGAGVAHELIDATTARQLEPALNPQTALHGALHLPTDTVGNCRQFALMLKDKCLKMGVTFAFGTAVERIDSASRGITLVCTTGSGVQSHAFDDVVIGGGVESAQLLRPLGANIPIIPVYGYSVSAAIKETMDAPLSGVMDERYKVAISRLGKRVRVAGGAQIGGKAGVINQAAIKTLYKVLEDWFPQAADFKREVQVWQGARPMLPGKMPLIGKSGIDHVWLNTGHGSSGWALSAGSAMVLADLIAERKPTIDF